MGEVAFLGYTIFKEGVAIDSAKGQAVLEETIRKSYRNSEFLELAEYYLRLIKNFSKTARLLTNLTKKYGKLFGILNVRKNFKSEKSA